MDNTTTAAEPQASAARRNSSSTTTTTTDTAGDGEAQASTATTKGRKKLRVPRLPKLKSLSWKQLWRTALDWLANPVNLALFVWCLVATGAFVVFAVCKLHLLDRVISDPAVVDEWEEVAEQILNALFVLMCLVWHPVFMRSVWLLVRWRNADKAELRREYCKGGRRKPHDRTHMAIVVFWLQLTCWATYAFAALYWFWPPQTRPAVPKLVLFIVSWLAPVMAFLHLLLSPLSRDYSVVRPGEAEAMAEAAAAAAAAAAGKPGAAGVEPRALELYEQKPTFYAGGHRVMHPEWAGSAFPGCCSDPRLAFLTCIFPFCIFGYQMERLGFGHRVVHATMFAIVLLGPIVIFYLATASLHHETSIDVVYYCGVGVALLGLGYGGLWRTKLRKQFGLPPTCDCCGACRGDGCAALADTCTWMWCSCCALCQEVRTADQYEIRCEPVVGVGSAAAHAEKEAAGKGGVPRQPDAVVHVDSGEGSDWGFGDDEDDEFNDRDASTHDGRESQASSRSPSPVRGGTEMVDMNAATAPAQQHMDA